jgi:hypothetical protein
MSGNGISRIFCCLILIFIYELPFCDCFSVVGQHLSGDMDAVQNLLKRIIDGFSGFVVKWSL